MNIENINKTIAIMERAKERHSVYMPYFQTPADNEVLVYTETEFHACGNSACMAGHIAISPEWLETPGNTTSFDGSPETATSISPKVVIGDWWGVPPWLVSYFVYGAKRGLENRNIYDVNWEVVKAEHVIKQLTLLRDLGVEKYCELKGI